jgi:ribosome-associated toxin RatA of RatAB toxin-antitoxin module
MNTTKITILFYIFLGISFFSLIFYVDSTFDRSSLPDILPSHLDSIETIEFVSLDRNKIYFLLTDVENYPLVLPRNILSVEIIEKTENTIIAKEQISERGITTTLLVKHTMSPEFNHSIEIIDGPAKGTIMNQFFEDNNPGTKITNSFKFKFEGILTPLKFLPKQNAANAIGTIISSFEIYGKINANTNDRIVDDLYREVLLRPADPEGLEYFGSLLESGKITEDKIKSQLLNSDELKYSLLPHEFKNVDSLSVDTIILMNSYYEKVLLRPADPEGLEYFGSLLESGKITEDDIKSQLLNSDERRLREKSHLKLSILPLFSVQIYTDVPSYQKFNSLMPMEIKYMSEMHPETIYSVNSLFQQILDDDADDASLRYFGSLLESRTITEKELEEILLELK